MDYIAQLSKENRELNANNKGNTSEVIAIYEQIPFFCCPNNIISDAYQRDIEKYIYCKETGTKPFKGAYGDTQKTWIDKFFIIKRSITKRNNYLQNKKNKEVDGR